ncbi:MAG: hypothetical protein DRI65_16890 [Chloroflexota bacterium]|nr:MAG: hypothetical protein DRI65_16890 [Chloroflexota bacterium]
MGTKGKIISKTIVVTSIIVMIFFETGCGSGKKAGEQEPALSMNNMEVLDLIDRGDVKVEEILNTGEGFGTIGEIFSVAVRNMSSDALEVEIPCGLVFTPNNDSLQPMMVIQKESASVDPGETLDLSPYVVCIDADAGVPEPGDDYTIGYMESGDLLSFAKCLCEDPGTTTDPMGVQFAVWMISEDINPGDLSDYGGEALQFLFDGNVPDDMGGMVDNALGLSGNGSSQDWLARCGIK